MPLIIISGYPSSGKTWVTAQLKSDLEALDSGYTVVVVDDEKLGIPKKAYADSKDEKQARGEQITAVKRALTPKTIVILDSLSYIKGFRYQLYCEAKALSTNSCVVHVGTPRKVCHERNELRKDSKWPENLFDSLIFRFEEPNGMNRWDSPLYISPYDDPVIPVREIWGSIVLQKPKPPNQATILTAAKPTNYAFELDRTTSDISNRVLEAQKLNPAGLVTIHGVELQLPHPPVSIAQLQRIRRSFLSLNKIKALDSDRVPLLFLEFLEKNFTP